jgi:hypothetical protein
MTQPIWITTAGLLGVFPNSIQVSIQLQAQVQSPATALTYALLNGKLPTSLVMSTSGFISGIPDSVSTNTSSTFTVRITDNLGNIRDRTFKMIVSGAAIPQFTISSGSLLSTEDSVWVNIPVQYSNPDPTNPVLIEMAQGVLPPGLQLTSAGVIQGYADPPIINVRLNLIESIVISTTAVSNIIECIDTSGFVTGRSIIFSGLVFGGVVAGTTYFIGDILSSTTFTITLTPNGTQVILVNGTGVMDITLPSTSVGQATINTYSFRLRLSSPLGGGLGSYSITVINQHTTISQGGPGKGLNTRLPVILNTRPLIQPLVPTDQYYGYYILPTVAPNEAAQIGTFVSGEQFAFKVNGHDFDGSPLVYTYVGLSLGLVGDPKTGWITGTPTINTGIDQFTFSVSVAKEIDPLLSSEFFTFSFKLGNSIYGTVTWVTPSDLGTLFNGEVSILSVVATSDTTLSYRVIDGSLPPNLILLSNGEISGIVADQPTNSLLTIGDSTTFTVTIEAYSELYSIVTGSKTFTIVVNQEFARPTDTLYIKATPSIHDRQVIDSLLTSDTIIPPEYIYREGDIYFGKAQNIVYEHLYGIMASDLDEYIAAITTNHYWRNITLGEIKTAIARNDAGDIIYEVVYSEVIDSMANMEGFENSNVRDIDPRWILWDTLIDLHGGPWYTSLTSIYTSYNFDMTYYTSLSSGFVNVVWPNSMFMMREQLTSVIPQEYNSKLLPRWMTSQQANGSTLGYTQAWVIAYALPGKASIIQHNIQTLWPHVLNQINFRIDRFTVDKSSTYNYDKNLVPPAWLSLPSATPVPDPLDSKDFHVLFPRKTILPTK